MSKGVKSMRKSVIAAALVALAVAGCGGGGSGGTHVTERPNNRGSGSNGGGGSNGTKSPYEQKKEDDVARNLCRNIEAFGYGTAVTAVEKNLNFSEGDAVKFVKNVASEQCPELIPPEWKK
jgi:hypothetical protein